MITPKTLALEWMKGFSSGASSGLETSEPKSDELRTAWNEGYVAGKEARDSARTICEKRYGIKFAEVRPLA